MLSLKGENSIKTARSEKAVINVGDGLTINAADDAVLNIEMRGTNGGAGIGAGIAAKCGNINIDNAKINAEVESGAAIGAGTGFSVVGDINIGANTEIHAWSNMGAGIGVGANDYIYGGDKFSTVGNINIDNNAKVQASGIGAGSNESTASPGRVEDINYNSFSFDQQRYDSFSGNSMMQNDWMEIVSGASNRRFNPIDILSQRNASIALRVIEGAMEQIQRELSNVSNYMHRFITSNENNQQVQNAVNNFSGYSGRFPNNFV